MLFSLSNSFPEQHWPRASQRALGISVKWIMNLNDWLLSRNKRPMFYFLQINSWTTSKHSEFSSDWHISGAIILIGTNSLCQEIYFDRKLLSFSQGSTLGCCMGVCMYFCMCTCESSSLRLYTSTFSFKKYAIKHIRKAERCHSFKTQFHAFYADIAL